MQAAFADLPLALFTTLSLIGAGAFIVQAVLLCTRDLAARRTAKFDKMMFLPIAIVAVGFVCASVHMADPSHAMYAITGLGSSPLTNEVCVGGLFLVVAIIYAALAVAGKLKEGAYKSFGVLVGVLAFVFALFIGFAYLVDTIASWNCAWTVLEPVGFTLMAGGMLEMLCLALAGEKELVADAGVRRVANVTAVVGAVVAYGSLFAHLGMVGGMGTMVTLGSAMVADVMGCAVVSAVLAAIAIVLSTVGSKKGSTGLLVCAVIVVALAVFTGRLVFYGIQLSVAL
jgi:DMSO reductase anchor subunit